MVIRLGVRMANDAHMTAVRPSAGVGQTETHKNVAISKRLFAN